jgi:hypothetical protein
MNLEKFQGKKTYILIGGLLAFQAAQYAGGQITGPEMIEYLFGGGLLAAVKAGWERNK